jgi:hypothetical protein
MEFPEGSAVKTPRGILKPLWNLSCFHLFKIKKVVGLPENKRERRTP